MVDTHLDVVGLHYRKWLAACVVHTVFSGTNVKYEFILRNPKMDMESEDEFASPYLKFSTTVVFIHS